MSQILCYETDSGVPNVLMTDKPASHRKDPVTRITFVIEDPAGLNEHFINGLVNEGEVGFCQIGKQNQIANTALSALSQASEGCLNTASFHLLLRLRQCLGNYAILPIPRRLVKRRREY